MSILANREQALLNPLSDAYLVLFEAWYTRRALTQDEQQQIAKAWALVHARKTLIEMGEINENN